MIGACSALIVLKLRGWDRSLGIAEEIKIAETLGIPITYREHVGREHVGEAFQVLTRRGWEDEAMSPPSLGE